LSEHTRDEVRGVIDCLRQITTMTWMEVLQTAGRPGNKDGLAYTPYDDGDLHHVTRPQGLSRDIRISGIRAAEKGRVFGAYKDHIYYLLWFDRGHQIAP